MRIEQAIANGDIIEVPAEVSATVNGTEHKRPYTKRQAATIDGALALCDGRMDGKDLAGPNGKDLAGPNVLGEFNYGFDLRIKARERAALLSALEGPDKQFAKAAKALVALGLYANEEAAVAALKAQAEAQASE